MGRGERADRICRRSIARKEEGLAATSAEIDVTPVARLARLLHPGFPAEPAECRRTLPNLFDRASFDILKLHAGNDGGCMARQHPAVRRDEHQLAAPAADASLWKLCVIVRYNKDHSRFAFPPFLGRLQRFEAIVELPTRREQSLPVPKPPTVILHARKFDRRRLMFLHKGKHASKFPDILSMNDKVQGHTNSVPFQPFQNQKLLSVRSRLRNLLGRLLCGALETELKMVEPRVNQRP